MKSNFPSHQEMLDEFAAGMREHQAKQEHEAITVSPYLMRDLLPMTPGVRLQIRAHRMDIQRSETARINEQRGGLK